MSEENDRMNEIDMAEKVQDEWVNRILVLSERLKALAAEAWEGSDNYRAEAYEDAAERVFALTVFSASSSLKQLDSFTAVYQPIRTDDLKPEAVPFIGDRLEWQAVWIIDRGEEYAGQWACAVRSPGPKFVWVPECDLVDIEPLGVEE